MRINVERKKPDQLTVRFLVRVDATTGSQGLPVATRKMQLEFNPIFLEVGGGHWARRKALEGREKEDRESQSGRGGWNHFKKLITSKTRESRLG